MPISDPNKLTEQSVPAFTVQNNHTTESGIQRNSGMYGFKEISEANENEKNKKKIKEIIMVNT